MNVKLLIDSIMRQTTVLIAQLCSTAGIRAPLARLADEVFLGLSQELENQGLSRKVVADMFGMALRGYQKRVNRLRESATDDGQTLWQAVLDYLQEQRRVTRRELLERFERDDEAVLGAVLSDLVNSGLAYRIGGGSNALIAATPEEDREALLREGGLDTARALVWLDLCRNPGTRAVDVMGRLPIDAPTLEETLEELKREGRATEDSDGSFTATSATIPVGAERGWEAALFDHFQSVCAAMTAKLAGGQIRSAAADTTGGATLTFDVEDGHPLEQRVLSLLSDVRRDVNALWREVEACNAAKPIASERMRQVTFYFGQHVKPAPEDE